VLIVYRGPFIGQVLVKFVVMFDHRQGNDDYNMVFLSQKEEEKEIVER
jgi:hypothetical protein